MLASVRALVTGGAGFIGSAIARALVARGDEVRVFDNLLTGLDTNVPDGVEFVSGDLREAGEIAAACEGIEVVFHEAAFRSVPKSIDQPQLAQSCNVEGTLNLLMGAEAAGVRRVVYASSSSVYGGGEGINREDAAPDPRSPYAVSKLAAEYYCRVWTLIKGLSTVSLRYFNVFGPGQRPDSQYSAVFPGFCDALVSGRAPELHWDGEQSRDFSYIDDVVAANLAAAQADERVDGEVFNVGGGRPKTINEVLRAVADALGTWIEPTRTPKRQGDVRHTRSDISKAKQLLGWEPQTSWEDAVAATVRWFADGV